MKIKEIYVFLLGLIFTFKSAESFSIANNQIREKRNPQAEQIQDVIMQGVAVADDHSRSIKVFGQEVEAGYKVKGGVGDAAQQNRNKRDVFQDVISNAALQATNFFSEGIGYQDSHKTGMNIFGQKADAGYNVHGGVGEAANRKRRAVQLKRLKRTPCSGGKPNESSSTMNPNSEIVSSTAAATRRKRESEPENFNTEEIANEQVGFLKNASKIISDAFKKMEEMLNHLKKSFETQRGN